MDLIICQQPAAAIADGIGRHPRGSDPSIAARARLCAPDASRRQCSRRSAAPRANNPPGHFVPGAPASISRWAPQGGGMVKAAWFRTYAPNELPAAFDRVVQSWDTANKATELSDFSVCTTWGIAGKDLYLLHVLRKRMEYPELKRAVCQQAEAFNANVVLIEDKASGTQLIQERVELGLHAVTRYQPQSDKIMRMHAQTAMIENGFVHLPKEAGWRAEYLHELTVFPGGKYDDQVDSTAQLLDWLKQAGREPGGIYQYYKELAQGSQPARPEPLSVMAKRLGLLRWGPGGGERNCMVEAYRGAER